MNLFIKSLFAFLIITSTACAQSNNNGPDNFRQVDLEDGLELATFAGGCFWCVEAVFERVNGVEDVVSGYSGGKEKNPTYKQVSYGRTTHAEAVQITFDPKIVSYQELLEIFFATHDPTQLNRQGPDVGKQYRSAVYYHDAIQEETVRSYVEELGASGKFNKSIVTELAAYEKFYLAEGYHQNFYELNPNQGYVVNVTRPKVKKFLKEFKDKLKPQYQ